MLLFSGVNIKILMNIIKQQNFFQMPISFDSILGRIFH